ncbi:hypothetical protein GLAREA_11163 [Glarea lozoyensis ATCC 20868]|uniref:Uncharacterized protein n=1 Tax=Glarea lozoyensis (strain ATCC 20868 / MF5171) TaxID=1116229 RepID=S3DEC5_GLAL2|nr:uncharacterized protein GLAREA_11163 [Glarea lozoyensis ATCC 20868]EPE35464.1 hypothetical protein GLAREA_11163 [Glarea lozoyensis ATCC 20868]
MGRKMGDEERQQDSATGQPRPTYTSSATSQQVKHARFTRSTSPEVGMNMSTLGIDSPRWTGTLFPLRWERRWDRFYASEWTPPPQITIANTPDCLATTIRASITAYRAHGRAVLTYHLDRFDEGTACNCHWRSDTHTCTPSSLLLSRHLGSAANELCRLTTPAVLCRRRDINLDNITGLSLAA